MWNPIRASRLPTSMSVPEVWPLAIECPNLTWTRPRSPGEGGPSPGAAEWGGVRAVLVQPLACPRATVGAHVRKFGVEVSVTRMERAPVDSIVVHGARVDAWGTGPQDVVEVPE